MILHIIVIINSGNTSLHWACKEGHYKTAGVLIVKEADMFIKNEKQETPFQKMEDKKLSKFSL